MISDPGAPEGVMPGDSAFSHPPRCTQVGQEEHCSCKAGFHLSGTLGSDGICLGRIGLREGAGTTGGDVRT